ncbi:MAG: hypothetical protein RRA94_01235, partial [Bacteroidota bacterium]|nr:hypothetical protein [Bacteroidota bacterium]
MMYTKRITIVVLLVAGTFSAYANNPDEWGPQARVSPRICANAGQWDDHVRYALIGSDRSVWFCDDEIIILRKKLANTSITLETPSPERGSDKMEVIRISIPGERGARMIEAIDTLPGVANFYLGSDSGAWREKVSTHTGIRYRNRDNGTELGIAISTSVTGSAENAIVPGSSDLKVSLRDHEGNEISLPVAVTTSSVQKQMWLTGEALQSFMAGIGSEIGEPYRFAKGEQENIVMYGVTIGASFPVLNPVQATLRGASDLVLVGYNVKTRQVAYSTYLGSSENEVIPMYGDNEYLCLQDDRAYACAAVGSDFPVTHMLEGTVYPYSVGASPLDPVLFSLSASGTLYASSRLGGPGRLGLLGIAFVDTCLYFFGTVQGDTLNQITPNAIEPVMVVPDRGLNTEYPIACGYFAVLNSRLDSLLYGTYIDPSTKTNNWGYAFHSDASMEVCSSDGSVAFILEEIHDGQKLFKPAMTLEDIYNHDGVYIVKLSSNWEECVYATYFGFPTHGFGHGSALMRDNGELILSGRGNAKSYFLSQSSNWTVYETIPTDSAGVVVVRLSPEGVFVGGIQICTNRRWMEEGMIESVCGDIVWVSGVGDSYHPNESRFPFVNAFDTTSIYIPGFRDDRAIFSLDPESMKLNYLSYWNHRHAPNWWGGHVSWRPHGWVLFHSYYDVGTKPEADPEWHMLANTAKKGIFTADIPIPTPCWQMSCAVYCLDTLKLERRREYAVPETFEVRYTVTNTSAAMGSKIDHALIELPEGFELVSGSPAQPMIPSTLQPGNMATCVWRVRASDVKGLIDSSHNVATFRCRVFYVDPESGDSYPMREELCEKDVALLAYDEPEPDLVCMVEGPDSLYWRGDGFSSTPGGGAEPLRYAYTFTNLEQDTIVIASIIVRVFESGLQIAGGRRRGTTLAPGASYTDSIEVDVQAMRFDREIVVEVAAQDAYDVPIRNCAMRTFVPAVREVPCLVTGPPSMVWNTESGTSSPDRIACLLSMENPLDTVRQITDLRADLQQAVHLSSASGDSLARAPMTLTPVSTGSMSWEFVIATPPVARAWDTIAFLYECDGVVNRCEHIIEITVIDENVTCAITAVDSVTSEGVLQRVRTPLRYTLTNTGTVAVDVDRYELDIAA